MTQHKTERFTAHLGGVATGTQRYVEAIDGERKPYLEVEVVVAREGRSKNGVRYPWTVLREAAPLFEGVPMYTGHHSDRELDEHPDGIEDRLAGRVMKCWPDDRTRELRATCHVFDPVRVQKMRAAREAGALDLYNVSIDIRGDAGPIQECEDGPTREMRQIKSAWSLDWVQRPSAGGRIERMAASASFPLQADRDSRPGLAAAPAAGSQTSTRRQTMPETPSPTATNTAADERRREVQRAENHMILDRYASEIGADSRAVEATREWLNGRKYAGIAPEFIKKRLTDENARITEAGATPPKMDGVRVSTSAEVQTGTDQRKRIEQGWDGYFNGGDSDGYAFPTFQEGIKATTGLHGDVTWSQIKAVLGGVATHSYALNVASNRTKENFVSFDSDKRFREAADMGRVMLGGQYRHLMTPAGEQFTEAVLTSNVAEIIADRINKQALRAYKTEADPDGNVFPGDDVIISTRTSTARWDTHRRIRWQELDLPSSISEGAPYTEHGAIADTEETGSMARYGFYVRVSEQSFGNDDQKIIQTLPDRMGRALGRRRYRLLWDNLRTNATLTSDSTAIAAAGHSNIVTSAFSYSNVLTLMQQMRQQLAYSAGSGGNRAVLAAVPKAMVMSDTIYNSALEVMTFDTKPDSANRAASAIVNKGSAPISIYSIPYWDAASTTDRYWLLVDPKTGAAPLVEALEYEGRREPEMFVQDAAEVGQVFSNDLITYKGRWTGAFIVLDYRGFQGGIP